MGRRRPPARGALPSLNEQRFRLRAAAAGDHDDEGHAGFRVRHDGFDRGFVDELIVDLIPWARR